MNKEERVILALIKIAINKNCVIDDAAFEGTTLREPQKKLGFSTDVSWARVIEVATEQGVLGLCFEGVQTLSNFNGLFTPFDSPVIGGQKPLKGESSFPDMDNLMEMVGQTEYMVTQYEEHRKAIGRLAGFYREHGIRMLLMKGYGLSLDYPVPEHRPTGDIDVYLFGEKEMADELIRKEKGVKVDEEYHKHSHFKICGITVENHAKFIDDENHKSNVRFEALLEEELKADCGSCWGFNKNQKNPSAGCEAIASGVNACPSEIVSKLPSSAEQSSSPSTFGGSQPTEVKNQRFAKNHCSDNFSDATQSSQETVFERTDSYHCATSSQNTVFEPEAMVFCSTDGELTKEAAIDNSGCLGAYSQADSISNGNSGNSHSPSGEGFYGFCQNLQKSPIENCYLPSATWNALFLLRHAGEHFASNEIKLRHVLDLGTFFRKHHEEVDWAKVLRVYKEERMMDFYDAIATICVRDLGFKPECFVGYTENKGLADRVLEDVFAYKEELPMSTNGISGLAKLKYGIQKSCRWWNNRWKYRMVYKESLWESFMTLALNRLNH